jgi:hypothetical protein
MGADEIAVESSKMKEAAIFRQRTFNVGNVSPSMFIRAKNHIFVQL